MAKLGSNKQAGQLRAGNPEYPDHKPNKKFQAQSTAAAAISAADEILSARQDPDIRPVYDAHTMRGVLLRQLADNTSR